MITLPFGRRARPVERSDFQSDDRGFNSLLRYQSSVCSCPQFGRLLEPEKVLITSGATPSLEWAEFFQRGHNLVVKCLTVYQVTGVRFPVASPIFEVTMVGHFSGAERPLPPTATTAKVFSLGILIGFILGTLVP